ncbi:hypothetical protein GJAV_G00027660 [Gymnothorax javanicus]|nr:hypothetical protein GJAV_G00027660 [Gymnothorax javanicus]
MAGWKSGSDHQSLGLCSYVDHVPFKINDSFRSPSKVGLPVGFCIPDCTSVLAQFEYDFSLEQRVVRWGEELEEVRAAQRREQQEAEDRRARLAESQKGKEPSNETPPPHHSDKKAPPPPALNPGFDLADFESVDDPFDKLELKTLNDKEELRSILQVEALTLQPLLSVKTNLRDRTNGLVALPKQEGPGGRLETGLPCDIRSLSFPKLSDSAPQPTPQHGLPNCSLPISRQALPQKAIGRLAHDGVLIRSPPLPATGPAHRPPALVGEGRAFQGLTPREKQCVETMVAMGYPYEGVLKAMQKQGQNMEQVLDYLIIHTRLCERGFDASTVEECLEMYQCSEEKALEFLHLLCRFGEMGFDREHIKEVLRLHNNDQDKALEELMTRATTS